MLTIMSFVFCFSFFLLAFFYLVTNNAFAFFIRIRFSFGIAQSAQTSYHIKNAN